MRKRKRDGSAVNYRFFGFSVSQKRVGVVETRTRVVHRRRDVHVGRLPGRGQVPRDPRVGRQVPGVLVIREEQVVFLTLVLRPDGAGPQQVVDLFAVGQRTLHVLQGLDDQSLRSRWADLVSKWGLQESEEVLHQVAV